MPHLTSTEARLFLGKKMGRGRKEGKRKGRREGGREKEGHLTNFVCVCVWSRECHRCCSFVVISLRFGVISK